jgi:type II secretory pathway pseudopilin PulG
MRNIRKHSGFSEIELITFIVLIAVIVVLVNTGRDYAFQIKIKRDIAGISEYRTAIANFKTKYGQLPGDFSGAKKLWPDCNDSEALKAGCSGNGDGMWNGSEGIYVFEHLSHAEMTDEIFKVEKDRTASSLYPQLAATGQSMVPVGDLGKNANADMSRVFYNYPFPANSLMFYFESNIPGDIIPTQKRIEHIVVKTTDEKMDDGNGATGDVRASYDRAGIFGSYAVQELCTNSKGVYKDDEDNKYFCNFLVRY